MIGLPATGDNPGSDAVDTTLAGMVLQLSMGIGSTPIPTSNQQVVPDPSDALHNAG
jgi:hypothetical protein